jgi:hypothetical protein|tara:strand:- start:573 stop:713 length:141 start_codon:yes stop_codon:yes gene_type:complete
MGLAEQDEDRLTQFLSKVEKDSRVFLDTRPQKILISRLSRIFCITR